MNLKNRVLALRRKKELAIWLQNDVNPFPKAFFWITPHDLWPGRSML